MAAPAPARVFGQGAFTVGVDEIMQRDSTIFGTFLSTG